MSLIKAACLVAMLAIFIFHVIPQLPAGSVHIEKRAQGEFLKP